ncbi:hypothetical protein SLA2020_032590 [Shorea laevis]
MKLTALLRFIKQRKHFGKQEAIVYTVEFQKRGLPHVISCFGLINPINLEHQKIYITPCKAHLRLNEFPIHGRNPAVERLQFHLQYNHMVGFREDQDLHKVLEKEEIQKSMFTEWMATNAKFREATALIYLEFPTKWVWNKQKKSWTPRKRGNMIGRLYYVPPTAGEKYYLRLLLQHIKGLTCFNDLYTVGGHQYDTFKEACYSMGLIVEDKEWEEAINEAFEWKTDVIIWDEAHMDHKHCFEAVHHTLQDLMDGEISRARERPFGGKTIVMGEKYLNSLEFVGLPSHQLRLKVGAPIMLLRNLKQNAGLCNGTRLIVTRLATKVIEAIILTGSHIGNVVNIPRISLKPKNVTLPFVSKRRQFPVRMCYVMTINKSQGQTLKKVGIYLPQPVFTHGQLYVALSRVQERSSLKILIDNNNVPRNPGWNYMKNIVYKEIFHSMG